MYSRSSIGLLIKEVELRSFLKRKFVVTIDFNHSYLIVKNEFNRNLYSQKLGEKWLADIKYIIELITFEVL